jgi:hypothetical protein
MSAEFQTQVVVVGRQVSDPVGLLGLLLLIT